MFPMIMLIPSWIQNPYWQYFCGEQYFRDTGPCDPNNIIHSKRMGKEGSEYILKLTVQIHGKDAFEETQVICSTTVQEKDITFPTDSKLYYAIIEQCWKIANTNNIKLHETFLNF